MCHRTVVVVLGCLRSLVGVILESQIFFTRSSHISKAIASINGIECVMTAQIARDLMPIVKVKLENKTRCDSRESRRCGIAYFCRSDR